MSVIAAAVQQEIYVPGARAVFTQVMDVDVGDVFDADHMVGDAVPSRTDKVSKCRDFIKKLTLSQCVVENVSDGANTTVGLVSIADISLTKLLLS